MKNLIARFARNDSGATSIEYGILTAVIALGLVTAASALGNGVSGMYQNAAASLETVGTH